jgi:PAS domain S-box-containing protein
MPATNVLVFEPTRYTFLSRGAVKRLAGRGAEGIMTTYAAHGCAGVPTRTHEAGTTLTNGDRDRSSDSSDAAKPRDDYSLREIEEHFAQLVADVQDHAIFLLDATGRVKTWNLGAERLKGYRADEIIGHHFSDFYTEEAKHRGWPDEELRRAGATGRIEDEGWRVRKDGTTFWANVVITALRDDSGKVRGFLKITRDLTERKQAEERLRLSEERLALMIDSVQDYAIYMLDPEGKVTSWNTGAERIKGYTAAEIIGQHFSVFFTSEDVASGKPQQELEVALRDGRVAREGWRVRKDRSQFWANVVLTALWDKQGELRGFAKITRDLTDRRHIEELQIADKQKNDFLAMLAHELRNPLAPIRNGVQVLKMASHDPSMIDSTTEMMERQLGHIVRLIDDLLDVSRIVAGKIHLQREPIEVSAFIQRAIEEVQPIVDRYGHELMVTMPARHIVVDGDIVRLAQVVSNLLSNAAKYTAKPSQIWLSVEHVGDEAVIRVRDEGVGLAAEFIPRMFNLFVQADTSLSRTQGGLGVGLTLVRRIIELHGGTVSANSEGLSKGSEFVVRLPISSESHARTLGRVYSPSELGKPAGRRILVVDDNVDAAMSVTGLLKLWGHEVQAAFNGPEAIDVARTFRPQIVLLDIGMPGMSGYDVARQLRSEPEFQGLVITALTGYGQAEDRRRSHEAGFDHHLTKPPDPDALAALIQSPETFTASFRMN